MINDVFARRFFQSRQLIGDTRNSPSHSVDYPTLSLVSPFGTIAHASIDAPLF